MTEEEQILSRVIVRDSSWIDGNLWGVPIECDDNVYENPRRTPHPSARIVRAGTILLDDTKLENAAKVLEGHRLTISDNQKTGLCISTPPLGEENEKCSSCEPTPLCLKHCFGRGARFKQDSTKKILKDNAEAFNYLWKAPEEDVYRVAEAILAVCRRRGFDNIRWSGVGDICEGQIRLADAILRINPHFYVWGFTRRGEALREWMDEFGLLVDDDGSILHNVNFNFSIDHTMSPRRLLQQVKASETFRSGVAYFTEYGLAFTTSVRDWLPRPGDDTTYDSALRRKQLRYEASCAPYKDPYLEDLQARGIDPSVIFGLHNTKQQTHVSVEEEPDGTLIPTFELNECPATDPLGGGHITRNVCQQCLWCMGYDRRDATLLEHRKRTTVEGYVRAWRKVSLLDGSWVGKPKLRRNPRLY